MRHLVQLFVFVLVLPCAVEAQGSAQGDSLSRELVSALMGGSIGSRGIELLNGVPDERLPAGLFRGADVLGAGIFQSLATSVAYFPWSPRETLDSIEARLMGGGWLPPTAERQPTRGFVGSLEAADRQAYCKDREVIVPTVAVRTLNRTLAIITRQWQQGGSPYPCMERSVPQVSALDQTPVPTLRTPAAATLLPGQVIQGNGVWQTSAQLAGRITVGAVMAHYAAEFVAGGWSVVEELRGNGSSAATFRFTSADGQLWYGALMASAPGRPGTISLQLQLLRL